MRRAPCVLPVVTCLLYGLIYLFFAFDYRLHWDEPAYLYTASHFGLEEILEGAFQPSGFQGFYLSRIFHVLLLKTLFSMVGLGKPALYTAILVYALLLSAFGFVTYRTLSILLGPSKTLRESMLIFFFMPLYLYLSFKTLPEIPALLCSALSIWAFLKYLQNDSAPYLVIVSLSLTLTAFFKNLLILQFLSFLTTLFLLNLDDLGRKRIFVKSFYAGTLSLVVSFMLLQIFGLSLNQYVGSLPSLMEEKEPVSSILLHILLVGGIFYIAIPLAFLKHDSQNPHFFLTWFLLSTIPILCITKSLEARYFSTCMIAMAGLIHLSYAYLRSALKSQWSKGRRLLVGAVSVTAILAIMVSTPIHISIMAHELRIDSIDKLLERLDEKFGQQQYTVLVPWEYVDFHYLRLVYPNRRIKNVYSQEKNKKLERDLTWQGFQSKYYGKAVVASIAELREIPDPWVYVGFMENPSVNNLRRILRKLPFSMLNNEMERIDSLNHLELSWMWNHPGLEFERIVIEGQYYAYFVTLK